MQSHSAFTKHDMGKVEVCTVFENDYHYGCSALINSLHNQGYSGNVWIAHRGSLPHWVAPFEKVDTQIFRCESLNLHFISVGYNGFLANYKCSFIQLLLQKYAQQADGVVYFDPDIVLTSPWAFIESWVKRGIALCEDNGFPSMSSNHVLRLAWQDYMKDRLGWVVGRPLDRYYNSGFVGVSREHIGFLERWEAATRQLEGAGVDPNAFKPGTRHDAFFGTDQDTLNMACMAGDEPLATLGPEGMGFNQALNVMQHAIDRPKPWQKRYLATLLRHGQGVSAAHKAFWEYADGPIRAFSPWQLRLRRLDMKCAVLLSRFYHAP